MSNFSSKKPVITLGIFLIFVISYLIFPAIYWHQLAQKAEAKGESFLKELNNIIKRYPYGAIFIGVAAVVAVVCTSAFGTKIGICEALQKAGDWAWDTMKSFFNTWLKKKLLDYLVDNIIRWIQGEEGQPLFVTDWRGYFGKVIDDAVGSYIETTKLSFLCEPFSALVRISLPKAGPPPPPTCTLDQIVANIENFYNDFRSGGWLAFEEMLYPWNNPYGAYLMALDGLEYEASLAAMLQEKESQQSQGFLTLKRCVECRAIAISGVVGGKINSEVKLGKTAAECQQMKSNVSLIDYKCLREEITTPGGIVAGEISKALGSHLDFIVNADDLTVYLTAIVDAAINRLIREVSKGGGLLTMSTPSASSTPGGPPSSDQFEFKERYSCIANSCVLDEKGPFSSLESCATQCGITKYACEPELKVCYPAKEGKFLSLEECESQCGQEEFSQPVCEACNGGYYVRGRKAGGASCEGNVCEICTGYQPTNPCAAFCMHTKGYEWGETGSPKPTDPATFTREEIIQFGYDALFDYFGWEIPESCVCSRSMFDPYVYDHNDFGGAYSPGVCRECVPAGRNGYSVCRVSDWCFSQCNRQ